MNMEINYRHELPVPQWALSPDRRLDPGAAIAAFLAHPARVLVELGMLCVELMSVEVMPVTDPTVSPQVERRKISFSLPVGLFSGIFHHTVPTFERSPAAFSFCTILNHPRIVKENSLILTRRSSLSIRILRDF
jgi:hypothetical protein